MEQAPLSLDGAQGGPAKPRRGNGWVAVVLVIGTALRIGVVAYSSPEYSLPFWKGYGWPADHGTYVQWAREMMAPDGGLLRIYTHSPNPNFEVRLSFGQTYVHHGEGELANYPPLGMYLVYLQGLLHRSLDPKQVVNTAVARAAFDVFAFIGDILLALGTWRLTQRLFGRRAGRIALVVVLLVPPFWLDSCWWGQTDSWILAPAVWILWAMVQRRWLLAGVLWGVALSLKPQAVLLAPVWLFAGIASLTPAWRSHLGDKARRDWAAILGSAVAAVAVLNLTALPFWVSSGPAWLEQSYLRNLTDEAPHTTLKAFNFWYIDLLCTYDTDVTRTIMGVSKDTWGKVLTLIGLAASAALAWRSRWPLERRVVLFSGLWFLAVVMLATRVHERYILLCLPPLVIATNRIRRLWPGVIGLIIVACFQVTVFHWDNPPADAWVKKLRADTVLHHRKAMAQTPPELRSQLPTLEEALSMRFDNFLQAHRRVAPYEWSVTIFAMAATIATFWGATKSPRPFSHWDLNATPPEAPADSMRRTGPQDIGAQLPAPEPSPEQGPQSAPSPSSDAPAKD